MTVELATSLYFGLPADVVAGIAAGLLRSVAGWAENSLKDGVVTSYEWKKLAGTIIQYTAYVALLGLGLNTGEAVAGAFVIDSIKSSLKR